MGATVRSASVLLMLTACWTQLNAENIICRADIVFVIDNSGSIRDNDPPQGNNWVLILQFVAALVAEVNVSDTGTHIALVDFGDLAYLEFDLGAFNTTAAVQAAVLGINYRGEFTNTTGGLLVAQQVLTDPLYGGRGPGVPRIIVLITDGKPDLDVSLLPQVVASIKADNIQILAIGITDKINVTLLQSIASNPSDYHAITGFEALAPVKNNILTAETCTVLTPSPIPTVLTQPPTSFPLLRTSFPSFPGVSQTAPISTESGLTLTAGPGSTISVSGTAGPPLATTSFIKSSESESTQMTHSTDRGPTLNAVTNGVSKGSVSPTDGIPASTAVRSETVMPSVNVSGRTPLQTAFVSVNTGSGISAAPTGANATSSWCPELPGWWVALVVGFVGGCIFMVLLIVLLHFCCCCVPLCYLQLLPCGRRKRTDGFTQMSEADEPVFSDAATATFELDLSSTLSSKHISPYSGALELCKRRSMFAPCAEVLAPYDEIPAVGSVLGERVHAALSS